MLTASATNPSSLPPSAAPNASPTPSLDSLNGMAASTGSLGGPPASGSSAAQLNGDQHSDNGSHSESSSGLGSMAVNPGAAAAGNQVAANGPQNPNGVANGGHHGQVDRSSSTSSTASMCSSGLGSSPLGNANLPLFGGGISSSNTHAPVVNGSGNLGPVENGIGQPGAGSPNVPHQHPPPQQQLGSNIPKCSVCCASFNRPKVLHECFHTFCQGCLEKLQEHPDRISCPTCQRETPLGSAGVSGLLSDIGIVGLLIKNQTKGGHDFQSSLSNVCTIVGCRDSAIARCNSCPNYLCSSCLHSHQMQVIICFVRSSALNLDEFRWSNLSFFIFYLFQFNNRFDQQNHHVTTLGEFNSKEACHADIKEFHEITNLMSDCKNRVQDIRSNMKNFDAATVALGEQFTKSRGEINEAFRYFAALVEERKQELIRELEGQYSANRLAMNIYHQKAQETVQKIYQVSVMV